MSIDVKNLENDNKIKKEETKELGFGVRHVQALLMFFCLTVAYSMRVTMSMAIVAMTDKNGPPDKVMVFDWTKQVQDLILSSFFWGYVCMQLPGGQIAHRYGAKYLLVIALAINGAVAIAIPWSAKIAGWKAVCACRVLQGLAQGSLLPALHTLQGKWAPLNERGRISTYVYGGSQFGTVLTMPLSGLLAASSYGWPSIFYTVGLANIICAAIWWRLGAESPAVHNTITIQERMYIQESLGQTSAKKVSKVPWTSILTCVPVWAMAVAHMGSSWVHVTLFTEIPSYLNKIMGIDMKSNGLLSALPFLGCWIFGFVFSYISDYLINKDVFTLTAARKIANTTAMWGAAFSLVILTFIPVGAVTSAVITLIVTVSLKSAILVGFHVNHIDLSPNFAGTMMSLSNTASNTCAVIAPITAGLILKDQYDPAQWTTVFYVSVAMALLSNLFYIIFGSAKKMPWDDTENVTDSDQERGT
ncbi:putative inorganic phosphate cotransporter isoform X2 [Arctopsyche grandis]|uniref:putative inorganic phosphate cotransporter isoform X2 n=1 Tax=Arctopsyche grandis TaxID=121162 RepID=UPI00406D9A16